MIWIIRLSIILGTVLVIFFLGIYVYFEFGQIPMIIALSLSSILGIYLWVRYAKMPKIIILIASLYLISAIFTYHESIKAGKKIGEAAFEALMRVLSTQETK
ncbi:MAG: hypothetical protein PHX80_05650 [Candidatus Nanoarchaeia archaeon]|nr:hypothetical protein [Candidatus Nanoarchaeia archaeon]